MKHKEVFISNSQFLCKSLICGLKVVRRLISAASFPGANFCMRLLITNSICIIRFEVVTLHLFFTSVNII